jgi:4-amino-4-deoxy-L-arabinose transferase-like glycosyltransferase
MDRTVMTSPQYAARIGLLMMGTALLLGWTYRHEEASFADGLRYIRQAQEIDRGAWRDGLVGGIDHPLHPLGLVAARGLVGGEGPVSWQRAAVALACASIVLLTIPVYLLARDAFGDPAAWLGCALFMAHPLIGSIAVNALSESSFLLFWTWGLWTAVRYLREGRFAWLPPTIGFGVLAYLSRPEGMLLPLAMIATLLLLPLHRSTRIHWPRWWYAMGFLMVGSILAAGPYMALKGGLGTKPAIARVLGLAPESPPDALERERPLPPCQTRLETYRLATERMAKVIRGFVSTPLLPLALLGLVMLPRGPERARTWLLFGVLIVASAVGLVRLHATGGYCTVRHGLVPGMLLVLAAAHGLSWLMARAAIPGNWLGLGQEPLIPGPAVWALLLALMVVIPRLGDAGSSVPGPFHLYRDAGDWLAANTRNGDRVLDLTDWSLFFSGRPGYRFAHVYEAPADPRTRWVVLRKPHLEGHWNYSRVVRDLVGNREPVILIPADPAPGQLQLRVYDRLTPLGQVAAAEEAELPGTTGR